MEKREEKLLSNLIRILVETGVFVVTEGYGIVFRTCSSLAAGTAASWFIEILLQAGRRIRTAIRDAPEGNCVVAAVVNEIANMCLDSVTEIIKYVQAVFAFLKRVFTETQRFMARGRQFTGRLEGMALEKTAFSVKRN